MTVGGSFMDLDHFECSLEKLVVLTVQGFHVSQVYLGVGITARADVPRSNVSVLRDQVLLNLLFNVLSFSL